MRSWIPVIGPLMLLACGPSSEDTARRDRALETATALMTRVDASDVALRQALSSPLPDGIAPCQLSGVRADTATTGQPPSNYVEAHRARVGSVRSPLSRGTLASISQARKLLNDQEETFRWANGARLVGEAEAAFDSPTGFDLVLLTDAPAPRAGLETYDVERLSGRVVGWNASRSALVCGAAFEVPAPARVIVGQDSASTDLTRAITYGLRKAAFAATGLGEIEPSRYGAPSIW